MMPDKNNMFATHNVPCETVKNLAQRIDKLDLKAEKLEENVSDLDKRESINNMIVARLEQALNKNTEIVEFLGRTLNKMDNTLSLVQLNVEIWNKLALENKNKILDVEKDFEVKISEVKKKAEDSEQKSNIDIRVVLKEFLGSKIAWGLGGIFIVAEILSRVDWNNVLEKFGK